MNRYADSELMTSIVRAEISSVAERLVSFPKPIGGCVMVSRPNADGLLFATLFVDGSPVCQSERHECSFEAIDELERRWLEYKANRRRLAYSLTPTVDLVAVLGC